MLEMFGLFYFTKIFATGIRQWGKSQCWSMLSVPSWERKERGQQHCDLPAVCPINESVTVQHIWLYIWMCLCVSHKPKQRQSKPYIIITHKSISLCLLLCGDWSTDIDILCEWENHTVAQWRCVHLFFIYKSYHVSLCWSYGVFAQSISHVYRKVTKGASVSAYWLMVSELLLQPHVISSDASTKSCQPALHPNANE